MSAPFMQLYVADYLGDTRHLTTEQHGAYLLLLMTMWRSDGRLPNDDKKLARITGCTPSRWAKISEDVLAFFDVDGDDLTNRRLMFELEKASEKSIKRAEAGTKGGKAKALKNNKPKVANASGLPKHSSEPDIRRDTESNDPVSPPRGKRASPPKIKSDFEGFWRAYPRKIGKGAARKAYDRALRRADGADPAQTIQAGLDRCRPFMTDPEFTPHAATWLNRDGWLDEPEITTESTGPPVLDLAKFDEQRARMAAKYEQEQAA